MLKRVDAVSNVTSCLPVLVVFSGWLFYFLPPKINPLPFPEFPTVSFCLFMFAISGWAFVIPMTYQDLKLQWVNDCRVVQKIKSAFLEQGTVDNMLHWLAVEYSKVCKQEFQFTVAELLEYRHQKECNRAKEIKSRFFKVQSISQQLGFVVKEKIEDYLVLPVVHDEGGV